MKFDLIYPLSAPPGAPGSQISYPNTIPERIGPMIIYIMFDQNQMKTVGGVVFLVPLPFQLGKSVAFCKNWENTENIHVFRNEQILRHFLYL